LQVQRPGCEALICVDLYVLRWYAGLINRILSLLKRDIDVIAVRALKTPVFTITLTL
jgi:predicted unusual protein kinase regulating ubiquinone biosynthesis (AarF/ABC1/UbiB family)